MRTTAILIGPAASCDLLERQLALLPLAPVILGRVHVGPDATPGAGTPVLGNLEQLESICATRRPGPDHAAGTHGRFARRHPHSPSQARHH